MDNLKEKFKFEKPSMSTLLIIGGIAILWFIQTKNLDLSEPLKIITPVFLAFPFGLLGIFAIPAIRKSIKNYYKGERKGITEEIKKIRAEQEKIEDIDELLEADRNVVSLREKLRGIQSNRFERNSIISIVWFTITLFIFYLNLGTYLNIPTNTVGVITFLTGIYYLADMLKALFYSFER